MKENALHYRPPGLYRESDKNRYTPLSVPETGIPGFVGIAERGPTHQPRKISSVDEFRSVYGGDLNGAYLKAAIEGFFLNGGSSCYVVRVANLSGRGAEGGARHSGTLLKNAEGRTTVQVTAKSEGRWGDELRVSFHNPPPRAQTLLTLDLNPGDTEAKVGSTHGFQRGTLVRIFNDHSEAFVVLDRVSNRTLQWTLPLEITFQSDSPTRLEPIEFEVHVSLGDEKETFGLLSASPASHHYFQRIINERSQWVQILDVAPGGPYSRNLPAEAVNAALSGGADGISALTPADFIGDDRGPNERYGLRALEQVDEVDLIAIPDLGWCLEHASGFPTQKHVQIVQHEMLAQAERCRDRIALLDVPQDLSWKEALQWRALFDSAHGALYYPWLEIEEEGELIQIPPSGHIAGIVARTDQEIGTHGPPANQEFKGVVDIATPLSPDHVGQLNAECVNAVRPMNARGIRLWGARTLSSDPQLRYINVQRVLGTLIRALRTDLQWVVFEPNGPKLWKIIVRDITLFLTQLWREGMFRGDTPEDAFYVKCDEETNGPEERDAGRVTIEVGVSPVRPAEYIVFRIRQELEEPDLN